ncbi:hypothetical protein GT037_009318 [Alternaria burnsii]|uniref:Uncharacterized protein n=1 Tax=Alternaria burnsii TaxID=1187904 RepID=A0A8H7B0L2_9PLEO|nr:uncharacterized protein GT037_009318 [Alternaria burnsii]KAF7672817.1 hypothetical protein GT037_009318 [Alternaria burnsii]
MSCHHNWALKKATVWQSRPHPRIQSTVIILLRPNASICVIWEELIGGPMVYFERCLSQ